MTMGNRYSIPLFQVANKVYAGTSVTFYTVDGSGQKTATKAILYDGPAGSGTLSNPQSLDGDGKFAQPVYCEDPIIAVIAGLSAPSGETGIISNAIRKRGDWATATVYAVNDLARVPVSDPTYGGNVYICVMRHTSATFATDFATNGYWELLIDVQGAYPYVQIVGDTMTGPLVLAADPASGMQAATKQYVDRLINGGKWKASARAAATGDVAISSPGATFDGVSPVSGDRIVLPNQTDPAENGVYVFTDATTALVRAEDFDDWDEITSAIVPIDEGTVYHDRRLACTVDRGGTLGTSAITFVDMGSLAADATETVKGIVELATAAETQAGADGGRAVHPQGLAATVLYQGLHMIPVEVGAMYAALTNGASYNETETTTNKNQVKSWDFDPSTQQYVHFKVDAPPSLDFTSIKAEFVWSADSGAGDVIFGIQAVARSDNDADDVAFGAAQEVTDTLQNASRRHLTGQTAAISIAGSPTSKDGIEFRVYRKAADAGDTLTTAARLRGVRLYVGINVKNDA